jgi:DNA-binding NarL/FixJ family response regulator
MAPNLLSPRVEPLAGGAATTVPSRGSTTAGASRLGNQRKQTMQAKTIAGRNPLRVAVVDDHPAIREAISETVTNAMDMELSGVAGSASEAFELIRSEQPNVVVVDISLGDAHGLDLVQNLRAQYPELEVVVFSMYDEDVYAERAIRAGARAYVMKSEPTSSVAEAIRAVAQGEIYLNRRAASRLLNRMAGVRGANSSRASDRGLEELTDREMAVFQMLGQGHSIDKIASQLHLSRKTIETYRRRAKEKLGFETVAELLQYAIRWTYAQEGR